MKYCIRCGNQLPDDAMFCIKCGAKQPVIDEEPKQEEVKQDPVVTPQPESQTKVEEPAPAPVAEAKPAPKPAAATLSPRERYDNLVKNNEAFRATVKAAKMRDLGGLVNLLFIFVWLTCCLTTIGRFTNYIGDGFESEFSAFTLHIFYTASGRNLGPSSNLAGVMGAIVFYFGFLFIVLLVLIPIIGHPRSWILRTYETNGLDELVRQLNTTKHFLNGPFLSLAPMVAMLSTYVTICGLDYSEHPGSNYAFGEIEPIDTNLYIAAGISIFLIAVMLGLGIRFNVMFHKRVDKYLKK